mmetsp:Transcript_22895/g.41535  ORF Transcript_22895/g.41535 Transcript_22895/m.41535 type:complete len:242 (-) Transcript_22895:987-1712(-)
MAAVHLDPPPGCLTLRICPIASTMMSTLSNHILSAVLPKRLMLKCRRRRNLVLGSLQKSISLTRSSATKSGWRSCGRGLVPSSWSWSCGTWPRRDTRRSGCASVRCSWSCIRTKIHRSGEGTCKHSSCECKLSGKPLCELRLRNRKRSGADKPIWMPLWSAFAKSAGSGKSWSARQLRARRQSARQPRRRSDGRQPSAEKRSSGQARPRATGSTMRMMRRLKMRMTRMNRANHHLEMTRRQ